MRIIQNNDGKVTTKGVLISSIRSIYFGVHVSNSKKVWFDNKHFSSQTIISEASKTYSFSIMRIAFFVSWTI